MRAIILAAGYATRMYPLTRKRAKPLLDIGGRPMLSHLVDALLDLEGLREIAVVSNQRFFGQFEEWASDYAGSVPVRLLNDGSLDVDDRLGAIGDLAFAVTEVGDDEELVVLAGDNLLLFGLSAYQEEFRRRRQTLLLVREEEERRQGRYNEVEVDAEGKVLRFREKPLDPQTSTVAICLYFFPPGIGELLQRYLREGGNQDAPGYFIEWLVQQTTVTAMAIEGPWFDIGSLESLEAARSALRGR